ncbi:head maturation protease, ClpP-related [Streptomyces sp. NPDC127051]|uniref:head maturation protease, ClpP-related n=1 Tax=Streptomyces sp. NPDC127051 TaxID=3347119 RepID=UPI003657E60D
MNVTAVETRDWYRITNVADSPVTIDIFDEIGFWGVNAAQFQRELAAVTASEITVNLSSPGGEIFEGIAIYNALRTHPATITVQVSALAASIASVIAQAGDRIVMQSGSQMMIHEGSGMCWGNAADMLQMAELLDHQSDNIAQIYADRAGGTAEQWRERMRAETWFTAQEAVDAGLADEVETTPRKGEPAVEPSVSARWDLSVFNYAGREQAPAPAIPVVEPEPVVASTPDAAEGEPHAALQASATTDEAGEPVEPEADGWAALTAHLIQPPPDPWAAAVAHLLNPVAQRGDSNALKEAS